MTDLNNSTADAPENEAGRRLTMPRIFKSELRNMMYGFGDSSTPRADTLDLMEEMLLLYLESVISETTRIANTYRREKPDITDIKFLIRKDRRKLQRVRYLLDMKAEIQKATKVDAEDLAKGAG